MEWNIVSERGLPTKNGRYGIIYRYKEKGKHVYIHVADFLIDYDSLWAGMPRSMEILAWCELPPIPSQFII